jgi:large subunit ribosomal protein L33
LQDRDFASDLKQLKQTMAGKAKSRSIVVRLIVSPYFLTRQSQAGTGFFYTTTRRRLLPKLALRKYDPIVNRHVLFTEGKK